MNASTPPPTRSRASGRLDDLQLSQTLKSALGLRCSLQTGQFRFRAPGQPHDTEISEEALLVLVATTLTAQPEIFPPSQIRPRRLKRIIHLLRALCADAGEDAVHGLRRFVERRVVLQIGSDLTSGEAYAAYAASALHAGESVLSPHEFYRRLPGLIKQRFGLSKRHVILRLNSDGRLTKRNGWCGLHLNNDSSDTGDSDDTTLHFAPEPTQVS